MAKDRGIVNQIRALREAKLKSSGDGQKGRHLPRPLAPGASGVTSVLTSPQKGTRRGGETPSTTKPSSDAARVVPTRKPKSPQPPSLKASAAASGTTTHQYRNPEKRKAYMAKYMRERRKRQTEQRAKAKQ